MLILQEWLDVLQRGKQPAKLIDPSEKQAILEERRDNDAEKEDLDKKGV